MGILAEMKFKCMKSEKKITIAKQTMMRTIWGGGDGVTVKVADWRSTFSELQEKDYTRLSQQGR